LVVGPANSLLPIRLSLSANDPVLSAFAVTAGVVSSLLPAEVRVRRIGGETLSRAGKSYTVN
jgi:hypothetical protein